MKSIKGNDLKELNKLLLKIRLPKESARSTRAFTERKDFKANEWRDIAFYIIVPILKGYLDSTY